MKTSTARSLCYFCRGVFVFLLYLLNTIILAVPLIALALVKSLLRNPAMLRCLDKVLMWIASLWIRVNCWNTDLFCKIKWDVKGGKLTVVAVDKEEGATTAELEYKTVGDEMGGYLETPMGSNGGFDLKNGTEIKASKGGWDFAMVGTKKEFQDNGAQNIKKITSDKITEPGAYEGSKIKFVDLGTQTKEQIAAMSLTDLKAKYTGGEMTVDLAQNKCYLTKKDDTYYVILFGSIQTGVKKQNEKYMFSYWAVK